MAIQTRRLSLACVIWAVAVFVIWLAFGSHRLVTAVLALIATGACWWIAGSIKRISIVAGILILGFLSPVEASLYSDPTGPRVLPLHMGARLGWGPGVEYLPGVNTTASGEVIVVGSDVVTGLEPKWVIVW
jgi:hypothetical protein